MRGSSRGSGGQRKSYDGNRTPNNNSNRGNYGGNKRNWSPSPYKKPQETPPKVSKDEPKHLTPPVVSMSKPTQKNTPDVIITKEVDIPKAQPDFMRHNVPVGKVPMNMKNDMAPPVMQGNPNNGQGNNELDNTKKEEKAPVNRVKYTGREGEKKFSGRCRLFIANMNNGTTEEDLRELFGQFGETGEVFVNKEKGFGFIRFDFRHNAEIAKSTLDKTEFKGRNIQVRFATHASALEIHGLDRFASNEFIEKAMSIFGKVERAVVVCDDRGRSKGYAIVEYEWKKTAQKVLDRFKGEMFVLGRLPKPVFAKPLSQVDEEEGVREEDLERLQGIEGEREFPPRFISPSSFEYTWAKKWRDLYIEEEDKKARLDQELRDSRYKLELEMESALQEQEALKMREGLIIELRSRQEELRRLEEGLMRRQEITARITRDQDDRKQEFNRSRDESQYPMEGMTDTNQSDYNIQQQTEFDTHQGNFDVNVRQDLMHQNANIPISGVAGFPQHVVHRMPHGIIQAGGKPLPPPPAIPGIHLSNVYPYIDEALPFDE